MPGIRQAQLVGNVSGCYRTADRTWNYLPLPSLNAHFESSIIIMILEKLGKRGRGVSGSKICGCENKKPPAIDDDMPLVKQTG